jgi:hypothetical protein
VGSAPPPALGLPLVDSCLCWQRIRNRASLPFQCRSSGRARFPMPDSLPPPGDCQPEVVQARRTARAPATRKARERLRTLRSYRARCHNCREAREWDGPKATCLRHADRLSPRVQAAHLWAVAEAADRFLQCSIAELSVYADRRRDLIGALARLERGGVDARPRGTDQLGRNGFNARENRSTKPFTAAPACSKNLPHSPLAPNGGGVSRDQGFESKTENEYAGTY